MSACTQLNVLAVS